MNTTAPSPEQLLASDPKRKDGIKTPMRTEGDRRITFTWTAGDGDLWRNEDPSAPNETVTFLAVLEVTHHKRDHRGAARYTAVLWQHHAKRDTGEGCLFDGRNGLRILSDTTGAGRFNLTRLQGFAEIALRQLRERAHDPHVLAYFKPERV